MCLLVGLFACSIFAISNPPYLVYFQERSATLDAGAKKVTALAGQHPREQPAALARVVGYADSVGSPRADLLLSPQRVLVRNGRGQTGEYPGLTNRRVEIALAVN